MFEIHLQEKSTVDYYRFRLDLDNGFIEIAKQNMMWQVLAQQPLGDPNHIQSIYQNEFLSLFDANNVTDMLGNAPLNDLRQLQSLQPLLSPEDEIRRSEPALFEHTAFHETCLYLDYYFFQHKQPVNNIVLFCYEDSCQLFYINNTSPYDEENRETGELPIPIPRNGIQLEHALINMEDDFGELEAWYDATDDEVFRKPAMNAFSHRLCARLEKELPQRFPALVPEYFYALTFWSEGSPRPDDTLRGIATQMLDNPVEEYMDHVLNN